MAKLRERLNRLLGRGEKTGSEPVAEIKISQINPSPYQPRREFDDRELEELALSIERVGVIQPVVVRKVGPEYELVAGERRMRACQRLGLTSVPAIVRELDDRQAAEVSLIENLQRKDLNWLEEARGYALLLGEFGLTQEELAARLGKSQSAIANKLRLLRLPEIVQENIDWNRITERHARALLRLEGTAIQLAALRTICEQELTVKETEQLVEEWTAGISRGIERASRAAGKKETRRSPTAAKKKPAGESLTAVLTLLHQKISEIRTQGIDAVWEEREQEGWREIILRLPKTEGPPPAGAPADRAARNRRQRPAKAE